MTYRIGTRGSRLALAQAELVRNRLMEVFPGEEFVLKIIKTKGDRILDRPLDQIGGKGVFVREIEEQLLRGDIDLAVHSMKDMPVTPAYGLGFTKTWKREDARDVLVLREADSLRELRQGAVIGTGSIRRKVQLQRLRPDVKVVDIRGNVDTRIRKMEEEGLDGIVLAAAGLHRLGRQDAITCYMDAVGMIPAPAQGVLALEIRDGDNVLREMLDSLADEESHVTAMAEREFLRLAGGDCHMSVGAYCEKCEDGTYLFYGLLGDEVTVARGEEPAQLAGQAIQKLSCPRQSMTGKKSGRVYLLGAGPGDPGLLTVRGREILERADCIIYDRLVAPELLSYARAACEKIYVGKENHHHTMKQEEIQALLVEKAGVYETVVRLKGGDPYVFGRGGEEVMALREAGIDYEVIPGVTSAIAALSYAGIPVTHRGVANSFRVMTAHDQRDELADLDFDGMAQSRDTLIFLMGLSKLEDIVAGLMQAGIPGERPVAVVSHGTLPEQRVSQGILTDIVEKVREAELSSPAVIVVGEIVSLREKLFAPRCLVPKIGTGRSELAEMLCQKGGQVDEVQVGQMVYRSLALTKETLKHVDWFIFTSRHGVEGFYRSLFQAGLDSRVLVNCQIAAVGSKTAEALQKQGLRADYVPENANASELVQGLRQRLNTTDVVWYVRGEKVSGELRKELSSVCQFEDVVVYGNEEVPFCLPCALASYDKIFFTSGSSARRVLQGVEGAWPEKWQKEDVICSMGPACTKVLEEMGILRICESGEASYEAMAELV